MDFYEKARAADALPMDEDGDMLLFQWGPNRYAEGAPFEINLTRQFICADEEDDQEMFHLGLTYAFAPEGPVARFGSGNRWCMRPSEAPDLRRHFSDSAVVTACAARQPLRVDLTMEQV